MKLTGIFHNPTHTSNGRIYSKEVFDKSIYEYIRKFNIEKRKEKIENIMKNLNE